MSFSDDFNTMFDFKNTGVYANQGVEQALDVMLESFSVEQRKHLEIQTENKVITFREQLFKEFGYKHPTASLRFLKYNANSFVKDYQHKFRMSNKNGDVSKFFINKMSALFDDGPKNLVSVLKLIDDYKDDKPDSSENH